MEKNEDSSTFSVEMNDAGTVGDAARAEGAPKLSKNQMKRLAKFGKLDKKKDKAPQVAAATQGKPSGSKSVNKEKKTKKAPAIIREYTGATDGSKKVLSDHEMPEAYHPPYVEAAWEEWWEAQGFYTTDAKEAQSKTARDKFVMVLPPPNVTGSLHLGHALTCVIEDSITRYYRMCGRTALYVPSTDHAGIATQTVVEKYLAKQQGLSRHSIGREKFVQYVWDWKEEYSGKIQKQIRKMGASVDWSREVFTMDNNLNIAVKEAFVRMHDSGIVYRATRLVNWSCALKSAISDIEVDYIELEGRTMLPVPGHTKREKYEFGTLTHFAYKVFGSSTDEELIVATTRLETMLGDTGVAVHPDDPRYKHLHGSHFVHPFNGRKIPLVLDSELVDMEFGTGAVKITPAHDPNDFLCGQRRGLQQINILNLDGSLNEEAAPFADLMRYDARIAVEKALEDMGLLRGKEDHRMRLGICSRSKDLIEPYLAPQWYVKCTDMARRAVAAVENGELTILPSFHVATWHRWLDECKDWCVSRQLWWGHRIPAYFCTRIDETPLPNPADVGGVSDERWVAARSEEEARARAAKKLGCPECDVVLQQDPDVLDTWFSSGLFPMSVFGWPRQTEDLKGFFPTNLLETGMDILFFWVARMVMLSLQLTDQLPFTHVYLHPMVRDKYGRKMSKSLGNVIDPMEVICGCTLQDLNAKVEQGNLPAKEVEIAKKGQKADFPAGIPQCGTDALRFGLLAYTVQGRDVNLDVQRVVGYRNFCNKLWNATRFALRNFGDFDPSGALVFFESLASVPADKQAPRDAWILSRLSEVINASITSIESYEFGKLTTAVYSFWLYDLCDNYLELTKPIFSSNENESARSIRRQAQEVLYVCLDMGLRLLHPIMPFVTEDLWQRLPGRGTLGPEEPPSIMKAAYPRVLEGLKSSCVEDRYEIAKTIVHSTRSLRARYSLKPSDHIELYVELKMNDSKENAVADAVSAHKEDIETLCRASACKLLKGGEREQLDGAALHVIDDTISIVVPLKGLVDIEAETNKLRLQANKLDPQIKSLAAKISSMDFTSKVPAKVQESMSNQLEQLKIKKDTIDSAIAEFNAMA